MPAGDPRLIDRTDTARLAVTDAADRMVYVRSDLTPPLLDRVMLHEVAHAITVSWDLLPEVRSGVVRGDICAKPVYQYDKDGNLVKVWSYMSEASKALGIDKSCISACCRGKTRSSGGYIWSYSPIGGTNDTDV